MRTHAPQQSAAIRITDYLVSIGELLGQPRFPEALDHPIADDAAKRFRENAELPLPRARGVLSPAPTVARLAGNCWCSCCVSNWNYDAHPAAPVVAAIVFLVYVSRDVGL